jgi:hypothetical protein
MATERSRTTTRAVQVIDENLKMGILGAAVVVASNYVQLRLGSLLADHYLGVSTGAKWSSIAGLISNGQPRDLIKKCKELRLLRDNEPAELNKLFDLRNNAAHHTRLWKNEDEVNSSLASEARSACKTAKTFLSRTGK